jgi:NADH:ubiquinone oxidoreductase subunit 6 (subunit J)
MYPIIFIALALAELLSISLIFCFKDILHSVLSLAVAFLVNSLLFLELGQPLLALLQLFVMVGGIATFLFVGVASVSTSRFGHANLLMLLVLSVVFFAVSFYMAVGTPFPAQQSNFLSVDLITEQLASGIGQLYVMVFSLFGVGLGAITLLKRISVM